MTYNTTHRQMILDVVDLLPGCSRKRLKRLLTSDPKRLKYLERYLVKLEKEKKIYSTWFCGEKVYSLGKNRLNNKAKIPHDQICGEALIRIKESSAKVKFFSESHLRGLKLGTVPEWAALFPNETDLLFEYSTANNIGREITMQKKVEQYEINLFKIDEALQANSIVLFVLDAFRYQVERFANEHGGERFFYCDLASFLDVAKCEQLDEPIYIWGHDGGSYALKDS